MGSDCLVGDSKGDGDVHESQLGHYQLSDLSQVTEPPCALIAPLQHGGGNSGLTGLVSVSEQLQSFKEVIICKVTLAAPDIWGNQSAIMNAIMIILLHVNFSHFFHLVFLN